MNRIITGLAIALALSVAGAARAADAPKPSASFDVNTIHVDQYGSGEPALILIPGLTDSAAVWDGMIAKFAPRHTIYALTLAGFGGRPRVAAPLLDKADADIAALIAQQHLSRPVLIGHSMGGHLAIRLAAEHSDILRGAIAVDGLPVFPGMDKMTQAQRHSAATAAATPMRAATPAQFSAFEKQNIIPYMTKAQNVDAVAAAGQGADVSASADYYQEVLEADLRPQLANLTVPLLVIVPFDGTLDPNNPQMPFATAAQKERFYAGLLANAKTAKVTVVNDSRHFVMYDQPEQLYTIVQNFLGQLSAATLHERNQVSAGPR